MANFGCHVSNINHGTNRITKKHQKGWLLEFLLLFCFRMYIFITPCFDLVFLGINVGLGGRKLKGGQSLPCISTWVKFIL